MVNHNFTDAEGYNPFVGCKYNCIYCQPSFQRQVKRVAGMIDCQQCKHYTPHKHPERLDTSHIPSSPIVAVFQTSDISFVPPSYVRKTFNVIKEHNENLRKRYGELTKIYYFHSKNPICFNKYVGEFPENSILLTTLETNRRFGYHSISSAPLPPKRHKDFVEVDYQKKIICAEPLLPFDVEKFVEMILQYQEQGTLLHVWWGFNSKQDELPMTFPSIRKTKRWRSMLKQHNVIMKGKHTKGIEDV